MNHKNIVTRKL